MGWDKGFNLRASSGFVTDGANCTWLIPADAYPTTRNGVTFGFTTALSSAFDANSGLDPRLAGFIDLGGSTQAACQIDLPAAVDYAISLAAGDQTFTNDALIIIKDGSTTLINIAHINVAPDNYYDASDVLRASNALWVANQVSVTKTFATTTLNLVFAPVNNRSAVCAHLFVSQAGSPPLASFDYTQLTNRRMRDVFTGAL